MAVLLQDSMGSTDSLPFPPEQPVLLSLAADASAGIPAANSIVPPAYWSPGGNQTLLFLFLLWIYAGDRENKDRAL